MADDQFKTGKDKNRNNVIRRPADDEDEETYLYDTRKFQGFINDSENGVFDIKKQTGLNSAKSVFDKGSIFNTHS
ncbi:MAG: hypothetical protein IJU77_06480 [Butyrivibrio sp.]|nr:hypothetical protein [Butyrivibrio sp.]